MMVGKPTKLAVIAGVLITFLLTLDTGIEAGSSRNRRSPFKKHKIVIVEGGVSEGQVQESGGWTAPAPPPPPPPMPPPEPAQTTIVDHHHHHHTVVDHHHHHHVDVPAPPPPPRKQGSVYIEFNKQDEAEKIKKFQAEMDAKFEQMERDKQEKLEKFRQSAEEKLDKLAKIPQQIATDLDFLGQKIKEDIDSKKNKNEGVSIQIWKNKGGHVSHQGGGSSSASTEVHHHHHYHGSAELPPKPEYRPPPPQPPQRSYEEGGYDHLQKFADMHTQFMTFLDTAGSQYRVPVSEEGSSSGSVESGGYGNKGKGFRLSIWKSKGKR